ncbi:MAG: diacylglycerol kinase family protein [Cryomorphaceae bacterium]
MTILLIVNPVSGDIDKEEFTEYAAKRCKEQGHMVSIYKTTGENDREKIEDQVRSCGPDRLLSLGGDGNFILCCESVEEQNIPVGLIPMGSANGLALELGIPKNFREALELFLQTSQVHHLDVICVNEDMHCVHLGDVGINAQIVSDFDQDENRGMLTYAKYLTHALGNAVPFSVTVESEGKKMYEGDVLMVGIGNCRRYGTGVYLTKNGNPFDGKFELVFITKMNLSTMVRKGLTILNKEIADDQDTRILQLSSGRISFSEKMQLQLDGEPQSTFKELKLRTKKAHFPVIISPDHSFAP